MDFTAQSFSKCTLNPLSFVLNETLESFIKEEDDELSTETWDKVFKYIICCYDPNSPLLKAHPTLQARKYQSASIAGFDIIKEKDFLDELFDCKRETVVYAICEYLKHYGNSMVWAMIVTQTELFWEFCRNIATPIKEGSDKDIVSAVNGKSKMSEDIMKIKDRIDVLATEFYGDSLLQDSVKKIAMTPERRAKLKQI